MSNILKIALIVALIAALGSVGLIFSIKPKQDKLKADLATTQTDLTNTKGDLDKSKKELASTKKELDQKKIDLTTAKADAETAKADKEKAEAKAAEADGKVKDLATQLAAKEEQIAKAEEEKKKAGADIPALKAKVDELTQQVNAIEGEKKILDDKLKQKDAEIASLRGTGEKPVLPVGLRGKVLVYEKNWNFVVLNIGRKDGALENGEMTVYRNLKVVGKVKLTSVNTDLTVANVISGWSAGLQIQEGDMVIPSI